MPQTIDYDKLAKQFGAVSSAAPSAVPAAPAAPATNYDKLGAQFGEVAPAAPATSVTLDYGGGQRETIDNSLSTLASSYLESANPIPIAALKSIYQRGTLETLKAIPAAQEAQYHKAAAAFHAGNYSDAARYTLGWLIPVFGPAANDAGDELGRGEYAKGVGHTLGLGTQIALPAALGKLGEVSTGLKSRLNPVEQSAIDYGDRQGIPMNAGTRSGNEFVKGTQNILQKQLGAAGVAKASRLAEADALTAEGRSLANRAHPEAIAPEQAGQAVIDTVQGKADRAAAVRTEMYNAEREAALSGVHPDPVSPEQSGTGQHAALGEKISAIKTFEDEAYGKWREFTQDPAHAEDVQIGTQSATMKSHVDGMIADQVQKDMAAWSESARSTRQYQRDLKNGVAQSAEEWRAKNAAGAEVDQIAQDQANKVGRSSGTKEATPLSGFKEPPAVLMEAIDNGGKAVAAGQVPSKLYTRIRDAFAADVTETHGPEIRAALKAAGVEDTGVGVGRVPITKKMAMPVDVRAIKASLKPLYEQMSQWMEPARRNASAGFQAIKSIIEGPDHLPAEVAEQGLGGLKTLAREATSPDLRDINAGIGANAASQLQDAIDARVGRAGPQALDALKAGRMAHAAKMDVADTLKTLHSEPVQAFNQATWANDAGIDRLRAVAAHAPDEMQKVGRAYLDKMLTDGVSTDLQVVQKAQKQWQTLGPETKKILFRDADQAAVNKLLTRSEKVLGPSQPAAILDTMSTAPVQVFNQATWARDAGIAKLRDMAKLAPQDMAKIGRAYIDQLLDKATADGGFTREAGILRDWRALGPETKKILFKNPALVRDLDDFFMLAKKMNENPNPSGSASTYATMIGAGLLIKEPITGVAYVVGSNALARLLFSPKGARAVMNGMTLSGKSASAALSATTLLKMAGESAVRQQPALAPAP